MGEGLMRLPYHNYMEEVYGVARKYLDDDYTYTDVEITCREVAANFGRQWERVLEDFEIACDEINNEDAP
jgi:hypothetical protein